MIEKVKARPILLFLFITLPFALILGAVVIALGVGGFSLTGWLAGSLISWVVLFLMLVVWHSAGGGRMLFWMVLVGFILRLGLGMLLTIILPTGGYNSEEHHAGYLLYDAYNRDTAAWQLAGSGESLASAFQNASASDQYGGLLALSAGIYRYLSPDIHRPFLILLLTSSIGAIASLFLFSAVRSRWGQRPAVIACWIMALYPEAVMLGGSQMREPFLLALISLMFWCVLIWRKDNWRATLGIALSLIGMLLFSWRVSLSAAGVLAVLFWLDYLLPKWGDRWQKWGWAGIIVAGLLLVGLSWNWIMLAGAYDAAILQQSSGFIQWILSPVNHEYKLPLLTLYGLVQPLLPATIVAFTNPIASIVSILRSLGWYILAPFYIYSLFVLWKGRTRHDQQLLEWMVLFSLIWIVISSMRAGGDMWDNPRYRTIFLPFLATLSAIGLAHALETGDRWLWRWLAVEGVFLIFVTNFYLVRYQHFGIDIDFFLMIALIVIISFVIMIAGWFYDRRNPKLKDDLHKVT